MRRYLLLGMFLLSLSVVFSQTKYERADAIFEDALSLFRAGDPSQSLIKLQEGLNLLPNAEMYYLEGLIYERLAKPLRAISSYEACVRFDPSFQEAIFQKALIYLNHGDPKQALMDFNHLIESTDNFETRSIYFEIDQSGNQQNTVMSLQTMQAKLFYYRSQAFAKVGDKEAAIVDLKKSLSIEENPDYYIGLGLIYVSLEDTATARMNFKRALNIDTLHELAWYNLALIDAEIEIPEHLLQSFEHIQLTQLLASRAMKSGDYDLAILYLNKMIALGDNDALTFINRGRALAKMTEYRKARSDYQKALSIEAKRVESLYLIGDTYFYTKEFKAALVYYDQYLSVNPDDALVWYNGAMAHLELENNEEACHYLTNASRHGMAQSDAWKMKYCD